MRPIVLAAAFLAAFMKCAHAEPPATLDADVRAVMDTFAVPGVSLTIVDGAAPIIARGYGVREAGGVSAVSDATLFPIGSNTKAVTATLLATFVDQARFAWDTPVRSILPGFAMSDAHVSAEMSVRDLLVHRSGLSVGQGDLLFWPETNFTRAEIVSRIAQLPLRNSFRGQYAYDNVLYIVAGEVAAAAGARTWDELVAQRIFTPLGMRDSVASAADIPRRANVTRLHARTDGPIHGAGSQRPLDALTIMHNAAAAGGVWSNARDMGKWLCGVLAAHDRAMPCPAIVSARQAAELWRPQTPMSIDTRGMEQMPDAVPQFMSYALGWIIRDWRGERIALHTGAVTGGVSIVVFIPGRRVAFSVLTNAEERDATRAIAFALLDHYTGHPARDWAALLESARAASQAQSVNSVAEQLSPAGAAPHLPLARYAGRYRDAWYGDIEIQIVNGTLQIRFPRTPGMEGPLEHVRNETFRTHWRGAAMEDAFITFEIDHGGNVAGAQMRAISPSADFSYDFQDLDLRRISDAGAP